MASARAQVDKISRANAAARILEDSDTIARKALELRRAGHSFYAIAEKLGVPEARAAALAHQAIATAASLVSTATRNELLAMEVDRLDALMTAVWDDAMDGDTQSVNAALKIIDMRMKALGLDTQVSAVTNQTVIITGDSPEYRAALARFTNGTAG